MTRIIHIQSLQDDFGVREYTHGYMLIIHVPIASRHIDTAYYHCCRHCSLSYRKRANESIFSSLLRNPFQEEHRPLEGMFTRKK